MDDPAPRLHDVLIIGAGMAGLTAARILQRRGLDVVVVDKGRAVGGRMATRRMGGGRFDHGAQHFSGRTDAFRAELDNWLEAGIARVWFESRSVTRPERGVEARHAGVDGMRGIPEHLARGLDVRTGHAVDRIRLVGSTAVVNGPLHARSVVLTAPVPQSLALLDRSGISLPEDARSAFAAVDYDATLSVLAVIDQPADLAQGHAAFTDGPIAWIADNLHKGVSPVPALTIHSSAEFAAVHLDDDPAIWTRMLADEAGHRLGVTIRETHGHRWRYSQPRATFDAGAVVAATPMPIVLAGEVFAGARVEGAYLSGRAAADTIADRLA